MTIAIVDDHQLIVEGFVVTVRQVFPDSTIRTGFDKHSLFKILADKKVKILFLNIRLKRSDARTFMKDLQAKYPKLKIVIISSLSDLPTIKMLFNQGANGYLLKSDPKDEIIKAINTVITQNKKFISAGIASKYRVHQFQKDASIHLTPREKEILSWILKGETTKNIAEKLIISRKTVENHRANLLIKFDVKNVASLVKEAILEGYL